MFKKVITTYPFLMVLIYVMLLLFIPNLSLAKELKGKLWYCRPDLPSDSFSWDPDKLCYIMTYGDTLWDIAEKYYNNGLKWEEMVLYKSLESNRKRIIKVESKRVPIGTGVVVKLIKDMVPYKGYQYVETFAISPETGEIFTVSRNPNGEAVINVGDKLYDGPYSFIKGLYIDSNGNVMYLADTKKDKCSSTHHGFQLIYNKKINDLYSCGWDYKLLVFSPDGDHYAIRNNKSNDPLQKAQFIVLSDLGNGEYYDYIDLIMWLDDSNFIYRAQTNDIWRLVVNNKDWAVANYLDGLSIDGRIVKFRVRDDFGNMIDKEIEYRAEEVDRVIPFNFRNILN